MRPAFLILSVLALSAASAVPCRIEGQSIPSAYTFIENRQEIGPFFGVMNASTGRFGYAPSGGLWYGLRYGLQLGAGPMSLGGVVGLVDGTRDIIDPDRLEGDRKVGEGDVQIVTAEARLRFSATGNRAWHGFSPFLSFGAGVAFDLAGDPVANEIIEERDIYEFGTSFFGTLGLGTRYFLTDKIALRGDGTFSLWRVATPPGFSEPDRPFESVDDREWLRGLSGTLTLMYRW
jgi:hypothetical protein